MDGYLETMAKNGGIDTIYRIPHDAIEPIVDRYIDFFIGRDELSDSQKRKDNEDDDDTDEGDDDEPPLKQELLLAPTSVDFFMLLVHNCIKRQIKLKDFDKELFNWRGTRNGETVLHWATRQRNTSAVTMILDVGPADMMYRKEYQKNLTALHVATMICCVPIVRVLLEHESNNKVGKSRLINSMTTKGYTALHYATLFYHEPIVRLLLQYDADCSLRRCKVRGWTPLRYIAANYSYKHRQQKVRIASMLLEQHQPSTIQFPHDKDGSFNALYWAIEHHSEYKESIRIMLERDDTTAVVDVNVPDKESGRTPLHVAACHGDNALVALLLIYGANPNTQDHEGYTPLDLIAGRTYCKGIWEILLDYGAIVDFQRDGKAGRKLLDMAVKKKKMMKKEEAECTIWKFLSKHLSDPNHVSEDDGWTPLWWAAQHGLEQTVDYLLDLGANINIQHGKNGQTPLHAAVSSGNEQIVTLLHETCGGNDDDETVLENPGQTDSPQRVKLDPNIRDVDGCTALHNAVVTSHADMVPYLLMIVRVDPNIQNEQGSTALHLAVATEGNEQTVPLLLDFQATDPNIQDMIGATALHLSVSQGNENIARLLLHHPKLDVNLKRHTTDCATVLHLASQKGLDTIVQQILDRHQPDLTLLDGQGWTAFQLAVMNGHESVVRMFLKFMETVGNNSRELVNAQHTIQGRSALHLAARTGNVSITNLLLQKQLAADLSLQDCHGWTAMHVAVSKNFVNIVDLLVMHGANLQIRNNQGKTPIELATTSNKTHESTLQLLKYNKL